MSHEIIEAETVAGARAVAATNGGHYLVVDADTLQQIETAESEGAFEGGMTGNADGAPYSAEGRAGESRSSASDPPPPFDTSDFEGVLVISLEGAVEKILDLKDLIEAFAGEALGPMILVPKRELERWLNGGASTDGA